jgi:hypothetical protein
MLVTNITFRTLDQDLSRRTHWRSQSKSFWCRVRLVAAFRLPTRVIEPLALAPAEGSLVGSSPGDWAETGIAGIGMPPSKPRTGEMKLSKACIQTKEMYYFKKTRKGCTDQGALPGPFPPRYGRSAPAHQSASWRCLGTLPPDVSPEAQEQSFHWFPKSDLEVRCTHNLAGLVSSIEGLHRPANG